MDTVDGNKKPHPGSQFEFGSSKLAKKLSLSVHIVRLAYYFPEKLLWTACLHSKAEVAKPAPSECHNYLFC